MKKLWIITIFVLISLSSLVYSDNYNNVGNGITTTFEGNYSKFNDLITSDTSKTKSLSSPEYSPLVGDYDGNGEINIVVFDDPHIKIYDKDLTLLASLSTSITGDSKPLIYSKDLNNDNTSRKEIIIFRERTNLGGTSYGSIYNFNGTHIYSIYNISATLSGLVTEELSVGCDNDNKCLLVGAGAITGGASSVRTINAVGFNTTHTGGNTQIESSGTVAYPRYCMPRFRTMPVIDLDNDGVEEFVTGYYAGWTGHNKVHVATLTLEQNLTPILESQTDGADVYDVSPTSSGITCETSMAESTFTAPLIFNTDGVESNGKELVYAQMEDSDEFKMRLMRWDGSEYDNSEVYPGIYQADGQLLSNVFLANAQPESDGVIDFCVMGMRNNIQKIDVICANEQSYGLVESIEYDFDISDRYNITADYGSLAIMVHSIQSDNTLTDGNDMNELLTSYGVFKLTDEGGSELLGNPFDMELLWENPQTNIAMIPVDLDNVGWQDLVGLTSTNLWVFNDNVVNEQPDITDGSINPNPYSTWKINTSLEIRVEVTDPENDLVSVKTIIYEGDSNVQDSGWQENFTSGTTFTFGDFKVNKTINSGTITIYYKDSQHSDNLSVSYPFSVGLNGIEFGDSVYNIESTVDEEDNVSLSGVDVNDNIFKNAVTNANDTLNLGLGEKILYLLLLLFVSVGIWWKAMHVNPNNGVFAVGMSAFVFFAGLIIGATLGLVDSWIIITMFVVMLFVIVLAGWKFFSGHSTGGG